MRFLAKTLFGRRHNAVSAVAEEASSAYRLSFLTAGIRSGLLTHLRQPRTFEELHKQYVSQPKEWQQMSEAQREIAMDTRKRALDDLLRIGVHLDELRYSKGKYELYGYLARDLADAKNETAALLAVEAHEVHLSTISRSMQLLTSGESQSLTPELQDITDATRDVASLAWEEIMKRTLPQYGKMRVLEVECGQRPGAVDLCFNNPDVAAIAIDRNPRCVKQAQKYVKDLDLATNLSVHNLQTKDMNSSKGPMFDVAIMNNRLHTIAAEEQSQVIHDIYRLLNDSGKIVVAQSVSDRRDIHTDSTDLWTCLTSGMSPLPTIATLKSWLQLPGFVDISVNKLPLMGGLVYATAIKEGSIDGSGIGDAIGGAELASNLPKETGDKKNQK